MTRGAGRGQRRRHVPVENGRLTDRGRSRLRSGTAAQRVSGPSVPSERRVTPVEAEATEVPRREVATPPASGGLDSFFKLTERGTTVAREVRAGLATFMVMARNV